MVWLVVALAIGLRVASLHWNDRLQGDVNLFALAARELVTTGALVYPMHYDYGPTVDALALTTPATQHPPAWSFSAALISRSLGTQDTFATLKGLSFAFGLLLLGLAWGLTVNTVGRREAAVGLLLMAASPLLVDYSGNGSMYGAVAVALLTATWLLCCFPDKRPWIAAASGALASLAVQIHGVALMLPVVLGVGWLRLRAWHALLLFIVCGSLTAVPFLWWNLSNFGRPFYSIAPQYFAMKLGMLREGFVNGHVVIVDIPVQAVVAVERYVAIVLENTMRFLKGSFDELGPFCLLLCLIGLRATWRRHPTVVRAALAIYGACLATMIFWGAFRMTRFLVPLLPPFYLLAATGALELWQRGQGRMHEWQASLAVVLVLGTLGWGVPLYLEGPPTRYYVWDTRHADDYQKMRELAQQLKTLRPSPVLGYATSLDGGIETLYFHRLPFVRGRLFVGDGGLEAAAVQALIRDFSIRYIWTDSEMLARAQSIFPHAKLRLHNERYFVLELETQP